MIPTERERDKVPPKPFVRDDPRTAGGRIAFFQYLTLGVFLFLLASFWELQVRDPELYSQRARENRIKTLPILAPRGKILDRDGRVLVDNHSSYSLMLSRENLTPEHLRIISAGLDLDYDTLVDRIRRFERTQPSYEPVVIKEELTPGEVAFVESHREDEDFPDLELIEAQRRVYPRDGLAAHVVGYIGEVSEAELNTLEYVQYRQGDVIGKAGIERQYNRYLMGVDGQRRTLVDNRGRVREVIGTEEAIPGNDVRLTIDLDLQAVAELSMKDRRGAVVALDPQTGEVLAMVSRPAYDPNKFAVRIRTQEWQEIINNPDKPLLNRAIQAQLAPGSTFKPVVALAALETLGLSSTYNVYCNGSVTIDGHTFHCSRRGGHGLMHLYEALKESCNIFFYSLGNRLDIDTIAEYADLVGFGNPTGIDLPGEASGLVPSREWKMRAFRQKWYAGETISVAIGQGALTATPLQVAYAIGGMAAGGVWRQPHIVLNPEPEMELPRQASLNLEPIIDGMCGSVNDNGTGIRARLSGVEVCGKTGTPQLASNEVLENTELGQTLKDNAWFVGFAPREHPEIVVVALFEGGEHGNLAAPIARDVIKAYFDKKERTESPSRMLLTDARQRGTSQASDVGTN